MALKMLCLVGLVVLALGLSDARGLAGGYSEVSPDDKEIQNVASFVEAELNARSNSMFSSRVSNVIRAQQQVVAGMNYKLDFEFTRTRCSKMSMIALSSCPLSDTVERCTATVYKSLKGEQSLTDFSCGRKESMEKRAGQISAPVDNPQEYASVALRALASVNSVLDSSTVKVTEVRTQVVAGLKYYIKVQGKVNGKPTQCSLNVWSRPWLSGADGFIVKDEGCAELAKKERRQLGGVSGPVVNPEKFRPEALRALSAVNSQLETATMKVVEVRQQVVAGFIYFIKVQGLVAGQESVCDLKVWSRPWLEGTPEGFIATDNGCRKVHSNGLTVDVAEREVLSHGGVSESLPVSDVAKMAFLSALQDSNLNIEPSKTKFISMTKQTVAGTLYRITIETEVDGKAKQCQVVVWSQPWMAVNRITDNTC